MKIGTLTAVLWLWIFVPTVAHASSFALILYPSGAFTAIVITSVLCAGVGSVTVRVASAIVATLTAVGIIFLPTTFYYSNPFQYLGSSLGDWAFFVLGLVPTSLTALLVLWFGGNVAQSQVT